MIFWDSSALVPLIAEQPGTKLLRSLPHEGRVVWWGSRIECASAIARLEREGVFDTAEAAALRDDLAKILAGAIEVQPIERVRERAERLVRVHPLRTGDALQLAAALNFCGDRPHGLELASLDERLRTAARLEGFVVRPESV